MQTHNSNNLGTDPSHEQSLKGVKLRALYKYILHIIQTVNEWGQHPGNNSGVVVLEIIVVVVIVVVVVEVSSSSSSSSST